MVCDHCSSLIYEIVPDGIHLKTNDLCSHKCVDFSAYYDIILCKCDRVTEFKGNCKNRSCTKQIPINYFSIFQNVVATFGSLSYKSADRSSKKENAKNEKRILSIFLALAMILGLIPGMSFMASAVEAGAKEYGDVIAYNGSKTTESTYFTITAERTLYGGWFPGVDGSPIVIESQTDNIVITVIDTVVKFGGEFYTAAIYSSGEKVETGAVENGSTVHAKKYLYESTSLVRKKLFPTPRYELQHNWQKEDLCQQYEGHQV